MDIEEMMIDFYCIGQMMSRLKNFSDMHHMDSVEKILRII